METVLIVHGVAAGAMAAMGREFVEVRAVPEASTRVRGPTADGLAPRGGASQRDDPPSPATGFLIRFPTLTLCG